MTPAQLPPDWMGRPVLVVTPAGKKVYGRLLSTCAIERYRGGVFSLFPHDLVTLDTKHTP